MQRLSRLRRFSAIVAFGIPCECVGTWTAIDNATVDGLVGDNGDDDDDANSFVIRSNFRLSLVKKFQEIQQTVSVYVDVTLIVSLLHFALNKITNQNI